MRTKLDKQGGCVAHDDFVATDGASGNEADAFSGDFGGVKGGFVGGGLRRRVGWVYWESVDDWDVALDRDEDDSTVEVAIEEGAVFADTIVWSFPRWVSFAVPVELDGLGDGLGLLSS